MSNDHFGVSYQMITSGKASTITSVEMGHLHHNEVVVAVSYGDEDRMVVNQLLFIECECVFIKINKCII